MSTRSLVIATALVGASLGSAAVSARTVTIYFTGEVVAAVDLATDTLVPSAVGTPFSGYLTYDVSEPEYTQGIFNASGQPIAQARADSGCGRTVNGLCQDDRGTNSPVVTDYRVRWGAFTFVPIGSSLAFLDATERYNQSVGGSPSGEAWIASRNQQRMDLTGDPDGAYQFSRTQRVVTIGVSTSSVVPRLLKKPASNLEQGFNLEAVPAEQQNFTFFDGVARVNCVAPAFCPEQFDAGSLQLYGRLKSVLFNSGKNPK